VSDTTVHLAMAQMRVEGGKPDENLRRAEAMIHEAASRGCRIVVLPECLDLGWTHPSARELAQPVPGPHSDRLCHAAAAGGMFVVAGLSERAGRRIYNTAVLIDPQGSILHAHRKINILDIAQDLYHTGDRLGVAETSLGTIGLNVCADNFPESLCLGHSLARMGAQLILSPSAWAVPADHDNEAEPYGDLWKGAYTELARLYGIAVVGVSNVGRLTAGPWSGRKCIGCSLAVGPDREILAQAPYGEAAEVLVEVRIPVRSRTVTGTHIAPMLRAKGYQGP
jgi:predicted amidohydrolase